MKIHDVVRVEQRVAQMIKDLTTQICTAVSDKPLDGVKPLAHNMVVVSFRSLQRNVWTPEFYIQEAQADRVAQALDGTKSATSFLKKLREMVENKCVKIGANKYPLNDNTLKVLEEYLREED